MAAADHACSACSSPLAADQRFCLECGQRRGPAYVPWAAPPAPLVLAARPRPRPAIFAMPSPRVAATAAMATLAFGIVAGVAAGPRASDTLAAADAASAPIVLVAPAPAPPAPAAAPSPASALPTTTAPDSGPASTPETPVTPAAPEPTPAPAAPAAPDTSTTPTETDTPATPKAPYAPPVKHAWIVTLTGHTFDEIAADPSKMPYLTGTLEPKGLTLHNWAASSSSSLANLVVMTSGQRPTDAQKNGCPDFESCSFPKDVDTLPGQLTAGGKTWRAYVEGADADPSQPTCKEPTAQQRDPLVYFHSIRDEAADCGANIAGTTRLASDAQDADSAPNWSLVLPGTDHDGHDLGAADAWLKEQLDPLLASKAYADDGLVVVTFDAGPDPLKPVGALLISPHIKPGSTDDTFYSHTGLLRSLEDAFGLDHLGKAASPTVKPLSEDVFSFTTDSP